MKYGADVAEKVRRMVDSFENLRVLVVGDIIIDDYVFCKVQGLTTKDAVMSTRYDHKERYMGGSLAIARHLANFAGHVTLLAMSDLDKNIMYDIKNNMTGIECCIVKEKSFITPVKKRYLKKHPLRHEYEKLFSVNKLLDIEGMKSVDYTAFKEKLKAILDNYDLVVVCDYGHGLLSEEIIRLIEERAKYLAVNCQTNSSNYGMNVINKYNRADAFVVDERELHMPFGQSTETNFNLLLKLQELLSAEYAWVTLGANGAIGYQQEMKAESMMPAVTLHVKDTVGAGDAFYSLAVLGAVSKLPVDIATLLANVAGAIKTNLVGNSKAVEKVDLLKFVNTILNV